MASNPKERLFDRMVFGSIHYIKKWNRVVALHEDDPFMITVVKILFRLVGIVLMLAFSPLAIIGLFIGIAFVF